MIKINLLQQTSSASSSSFQGPSLGGSDEIDAQAEFRKQVMIRILFVAFFPLLMYLYENFYKMPELLAQSARFRGEIAELKTFNEKEASTVAEIEKFKQDEKQIQTRIEAVNSLSKERQNEIKILDLFQQIVPEKVWFTSLNIRDGKIVIVGFGASDSDVSTFQEVLTKSAALKDVNLTGSKEYMFEGTLLRRFEIGAVLESPE